MGGSSCRRPAHWLQLKRDLVLDASVIQLPSYRRALNWAARLCFSCSVRRIFLRKGLEPSRSGHKAQSVATHLRTSAALPQQQSRHFARMAFIGFCALKFWDRISEGTSDGLRPTSSPPSTSSPEISSRELRSLTCISERLFGWLLSRRSGFEPKHPT